MKATQGPAVPTNVFILGSCVSRDAFSLGDQGLSLSGYLARTSLASAFHPRPAPEALGRLADGIESSFQRRMVLTDLNKRASVILGQTRFDVLLVDLIDERFNLICVKSDSGRPGWYTLSAELSRIHEGAGRLIFPDSEERWQAWKRGVARLLDIVPASKIVLNRAMWAESDTTGESLEGPWRVQEHNMLLSRMYDYIESSARVRVISYPDGVVADPAHKWGLAPFHYDERTYRYMLDRLKALIRIERGSIENDD
jgi:hypothetical protein